MEIEDIKNPVEVYVYIIRETDSAFLISESEDDFGTKIWLPKSQIYYDDEVSEGDCFLITIPEWLAIEKEFV